jgi:hypothetical protein
MDDRRETEAGPDEAIFASARVRAGGVTRPWLGVAGSLVALGGLVAMGLSQVPAPEPRPTAEAVVATSLVAQGQPRSERFTGESLTGPAGKPAPTPQASRAMAPIVISEPGGAIELTIRRHPASMFIHGDVYVAGVSWVFVNITDEDGRIAGWTQVSVPGGAVAPGGTRPALRFDVELALPDWATGPLSVRANAYASDGNSVASEELGVDADGSPLVGGHGRLGIGG